MNDELLYLDHATLDNPHAYVTLKELEATVRQDLRTDLAACPDCDTQVRLWAVAEELADSIWGERLYQLAVANPEALLTRTPSWQAYVDMSPESLINWNLRLHLLDTLEPLADELGLTETITVTLNPDGSAEIAGCPADVHVELVEDEERRKQLHYQQGEWVVIYEDEVIRSAPGIRVEIVEAEPPNKPNRKQGATAKTAAPKRRRRQPNP